MIQTTGTNKLRMAISQGSIITVFLYIAPIVDNLLGSTMRQTGQDGTLGKIYRILFLAALALLILSLRKISTKKAAVLAGIMGVAFTLPLIYTLLASDITGILSDYVQIAKLMYPLILYYACEVCVEKGRMGANQILNVVNFYRWFYPLSLTVPYALGIGYQAYGSYDAGYSGFYGAANELSIVLVVMYILSLSRFIEQKRKADAASTLLNAIALILTGTKTGILMLVMATVVLVLKNKSITKVIKRVIAISIVTIVFGLLIYYFYEDILQANFEMMQYKYNQLNTDFITFMLSNRNMKIDPNWNDLIHESENPLIHFLIGKGYYRQVLTSYRRQGIAYFGLIEMDLFDMFFQHGILVTIAIYCFYLNRIFAKSPPPPDVGVSFCGVGCLGVQLPCGAHPAIYAALYHPDPGSASEKISRGRTDCRANSQDSGEVAREVDLICSARNITEYKHIAHFEACHIDDTASCAGY